MIAAIIIIIATFFAKLFIDKYQYTKHPDVSIKHGKEWAISAMPYGIAVLILRDQLGISFLPGLLLTAAMVMSVVWVMFNGIYAIFVLKKDFWFVGTTAWTDRMLRKLNPIWRKIILIGLSGGSLVIYIIIYIKHH